MFRKRPSVEIAIAHSRARIREPESAFHILTPEAWPEQSVIPESFERLRFSDSQHFFVEGFNGELALSLPLSRSAYRQPRVPAPQAS
jgi:hypothetical protein